MIVPHSFNCVISTPNPVFDHLLESSQWDSSNTWSNIGFGEEIGIVEINICTLSGALVSFWLSCFTAHTHSKVWYCKIIKKAHFHRFNNIKNNILRIHNKSTSILHPHLHMAIDESILYLTHVTVQSYLRIASTQQMSDQHSYRQVAP